METHSSPGDLPLAPKILTDRTLAVKLHNRCRFTDFCIFKRFHKPSSPLFI